MKRSRAPTKVAPVDGVRGDTDSDNVTVDSGVGIAVASESSGRMARLSTAVAALVCSHLAVADHAAVSRTNRHLRQVTRLPAASPQSVIATELWQLACDSSGNAYCRRDKRLFCSISRKRAADVAVPDGCFDGSINRGGDRGVSGGYYDDMLAAVNSRLSAAALCTRPQKLVWDSDDISWMLSSASSSLLTISPLIASYPPSLPPPPPPPPLQSPQSSLAFCASLRHLALGAPNTVSWSDDWTALAALRNLAVFENPGGCSAPAMWYTVCRLPALTELRVHAMSPLSCMAEFAYASALKRLVFRGVASGYCGEILVEALASTLPDLPRLESLAFKCQQRLYSGLIASVNKVLERLPGLTSVSGLCIRSREWRGTDAIRLLGQRAASCSRLARIDLATNDADALDHVLTTFPALHHLTLRLNGRDHVEGDVSRLTLPATLRRVEMVGYRCLGDSGVSNYSAGAEDASFQSLLRLFCPAVGSVGSSVGGQRSSPTGGGDERDAGRNAKGEAAVNEGTGGDNCDVNDGIASDGQIGNDSVSSDVKTRPSTMAATATPTTTTTTSATSVRSPVTHLSLRKCELYGPLGFRMPPRFDLERCTLTALTLACLSECNRHGDTTHLRTSECIEVRRRTTSTSDDAAEEMDCENATASPTPAGLLRPQGCFASWPPTRPSPPPVGLLRWPSSPSPSSEDLGAASEAALRTPRVLHAASRNAWQPSNRLGVWGYEWARPLSVLRLIRDLRLETALTALECGGVASVVHHTDRESDERRRAASLADLCRAISALPRLEKISLVGITTLTAAGRNAIRALVAALPSPPALVD